MRLHWLTFPSPRWLISAFAFCSLLTGKSSVAAEPVKEHEAETLFRDMEKQVMNAKSLQWNFTGDVETLGSFTGKVNRDGSFNGSLTLAEGNKCNLEASVALTMDKTTSKWLTISDGPKMRGTTGSFWGPAKIERRRDAPQDLNVMFRAAITRSGFHHSHYFIGVDAFQSLDKKGKSFKIDEFFKVAGFSLGKKEKVGEHEAQVIQYKLGASRPVRLWLDAKTNLPLKREVVIGGVAGEHTTTETYATLSLDGKVDPKKFELPEE